MTRSACDAVSKDERALARAIDANREARHFVVVDESIAIDVWHHRLDGALGQMLLHACH